MRAWVTAHDGFRVGAVLVAIGVAGSLYTYLRVPVPYGGKVPMWFLIPSALAMVAALAVHNELPDGEGSPRVRGARLGWALVVLCVVGAAAAVVGARAGQQRMPELAVALTSVAFGLSVLVGRGSAAIGAACLVTTIVSTRALYHLTPASLWASLGTPGQLAFALACVGCLLAYVRFGSRSPSTALTG
ncbi:hypothetical protein [Nocardioides stalactiti]|uniref:hypothetical protein n=1 Tax=Nocardioides stalactiti TaxID=2755356 RepID=UPI001601D30D|nr:hypothetical protein [Nocardioides stalactiti]